MNNHEMGTIIKKLENTVFRYYNCNPHHKRTEDCVIRAIATGMNKSWGEVLQELTKYSLDIGYIYNVPELYGKYLADNGWIKQKQPICPNGKKMKIKDFVKTFKGAAIIHAGAGHVSYISDGKLYDIWNCEEQIIGNYWTPKGE